MSVYSGSRCSEEKEMDLLYLEIEERILLLISDDEEEDGAVKKTERAAQLPSNKYSIFLDASWYNSPFNEQLQQTKQRREGCYGRESFGKKNKPRIQYWDRNSGVQRTVSEISGRRGTGVFLPKSIAHSC